MASGLMVETELAGPHLALTEEDEQNLLEESDKEIANSDSEEQEIELTIDTTEAFSDEEEDENTGNTENQRNIPSKPSLQTKPLTKAWGKRGVNGKRARGHFRGRYALHQRSAPVIRPSQRPNFLECRFSDAQDPPMRNQPFRLDPTNQPNPMCFSYNLNEKPPPNFGNNQSNNHEKNVNGGHAVQNGGKIFQNGEKVVQGETFLNGGNNVNIGSHFVNKRLDKHGVFRGSDEPELIMNNLKKEFPNEVKKENHNGNTEIKVEEDSDDSDIEMVAVVDSKKGKKYKAIKVEDEKDVKTRIKDGVAVHASHNSLGEQIHITDRIREFYATRKQEITGKRPLIAPQFMKGRIENPKYKTLKRTIPEEEIQNDNVKKAKTQGNYQVEISGLPTDWIQEGVEKITSIANAYGDSTSEEMPTLKVFQNPDNSFVIIFKKVQYAVKMYEMLNQREIDQFVVKVSEPHLVD